MWPSLLKIQYTELKLSCGNDHVVKIFIYSNGDLDLWPNDPKINRVLPLPQGNHVAKFGKDLIYRTKVIVRKPVWTPARHTQSHNTAPSRDGRIIIYMINHPYVKFDCITTILSTDVCDAIIYVSACFNCSWKLCNREEYITVLVNNEEDKWRKCRCCIEINIIKYKWSSKEMIKKDLQQELTKYITSTMLALNDFLTLINGIFIWGIQIPKCTPYPRGSVVLALILINHWC